MVADDHSGGPGQNIVRAREGEAGSGIRTKTVGVARADAEGRGEVLNFSGAVSSEEGGAVAEGAHVQGGVEGRHGDLEGGSEAALPIHHRVQSGARIIIGVEDDGGQGVDLALKIQGAHAAKAAVARDAEGRAGQDADWAAAERSAAGAGDLEGTHLDVGSTRVGVGRARNAQGAVGGGGTAEFIQGTGTADLASQFQEARAATGRVHVGISAAERRAARDLERVAVAASQGEGVVGDGERPNLDLVPGVGGDAVHVERARTGDGKGQAVGGLVSKDDSSVRAAAVAVELQGAAVQGDRSGGASIGTAESEWVLGDQNALVDGHAAGEAVLVGVGVVGGDVAQRQGAGAVLDQAGRAAAGADRVHDVPEERRAGDPANGQGAWASGGVAHRARRAAEGGERCVRAVDVESGGVVKNQVRRLAGRGSGSCEGHRAFIDGQVSKNGVVCTRENQIPCAELGEGPARDAAAEGRGAAGVTPADIDDAFTARRAARGGDGIEDEVGGNLRCSSADTVDEDTASVRDVGRPETEGSVADV